MPNGVNLRDDYPNQTNGILEINTSTQSGTDRKMFSQ